jgi:ribonuclease HI
MARINVLYSIRDKPNLRSDWQLHSPSLDLQAWLSSQSNYTLCFDGASKGNPGEVGAGGVLFDPRGNQLMEYSWNLGATTNNKAEAYTMYMGIQLAKKRKITELNIVGDSKNTIRYFIKASSPKETSLENLVDRIRKYLQGLQAHFFHILHHHNTVVDSLANKAIGLAPGHMGVNGMVLVVPPP